MLRQFILFVDFRQMDINVKAPLIVSQVSAFFLKSTKACKNKFPSQGQWRTDDSFCKPHITFLLTLFIFRDAVTQLAVCTASFPKL